jgi:hypothetical protein
MMDYAALALKLKPYILPWVTGSGGGSASAGGGAVAPHALSGAQHTGQLAQSQATWAATVAALNAHALNANAHHAQIHGLDSTNHTGTLAWAKVSKSGSDLAHLEARAHGSLTGIGPNQHHNQVHDITGSDHTIGGSPWDVVGRTAAGALGLIASLDNVSGGQTALLRSNAGVLTLKQGTASDRFRTPLIDTASGNMTIAPVGDLLFSPGGNDVIIDDADVFRSDNFLAGFPLAGFRIGPTSIAGQSGMQAGSGEFDELRARIFVADETRVDRGQEYITKSYGVLSRAFTVPAAVGGTAFAYFENSPHIAGAIFSSGDWVLFRYLDMSSGIVLTSVWGQVTGYTVSGLTGEQRWTFTLRQGTGGLAFAAGAMAVNFGASGQGYILSDAVTSTSPFIQIGKWVTNPYTPANRTVLTQIGRLDGVGFSGEYGIAASVSGFAAADPWLKASTGGVAINNADAVWTTGGVEVVKVTTATGVRVNAQTGGYTAQRAYSFVTNTGAESGGLYSYINPTAAGYAYLGLFNNNNQAGAAPAGSSELRIESSAQNGKAAMVVLQANELGGYENASLSVNVASNKGYVGFDPQLLGPSNLANPALPAYTFDGETNKGMFNAGVGYLGFSTAGVARMTLSSVELLLNVPRVWSEGKIYARAGARVDDDGPVTMSAGWRRIGYFTAAGGNRGHARVTLYNMGGARPPWLVEIDAFHSYSLGASSLFVKDHRQSDVSGVRITNDGTTAYLECNFGAALDSLYYVREVGGWDNSGFTLYGTAVGGGGTVECSVTTAGGISVANTSSSTSYLPNLVASGGVAATLFTGQAGGVAAPGFTFAGTGTTGLFGTSLYTGLVLEENAVLISRLDNGDSYLRLGLGNTNNRSSFVDFFANGAAPTTQDARMIRTAGANGELQIVNYGTGRLLLNAVNAAMMDFATANATRMRILSGGDVGIGTLSPGYKLHVNGVIFSEDTISGAVLVARGNPGVGFAGSTRFTNGTVGGGSSSSWDGFIRAYVGTQAVNIPYKNA